jgi:hypothetical protein
MKENKEHRLSRRAFTHRAALLSASASIVPVGLILPAEVFAATPGQLPENLPKPSPEGQAEADARFQMVLGRYGSRLSEEEKRSAKMLCFSLQNTLERVRAYPLENGDVPAIFLKPLLDRNLQSRSTPAAIPVASPKNS